VWLDPFASHTLYGALTLDSLRGFSQNLARIHIRLPMDSHPAPRADASLLPHPLQLEVLEFGAYALVIDARSPHEYDEDHLPGAVNLPVVDDAEYAEVGTKHKDDKHAAYLIGVEYSLRNIAKHIKPLIAQYGNQDRMLVYCFRGGKRSKLWADNLTHDRLRSGRASRRLEELSSLGPS